VQLSQRAKHLQRFNAYFMDVFQ